MTKKSDDERKVEQARALEQAISGMRDNWAGQVELHQMLAKLARVRYLAFLKEGFTEQEALLLRK